MPHTGAPASVEVNARRQNSALVLSDLFWIPQAACAAAVLATLSTEPGQPGRLAGLLAGFSVLGILRALLAYWAQLRLDGLAEQEIHRLRAVILESQDRQSPLSATRLTSAAASALAVEKLALLKPYLVRYRPARIRAGLVPVAVLSVCAVQAWAVAVILLISGPMIPLFMALIGVAAKAASARQMEEIGSLNSLLQDRLQGLVDIRLLDATDRMVQSFEAAAADLKARTMAVLRVAFLSSTVLELFAALGVAMVAVFVGFTLLGQISFGTSATSLGLFEGIWLLMLAPAFFQPLRELAAAWHDKAAADAVLEEAAQAVDRSDDTILGRAADRRAEGGSPGEIALAGVALDIGQAAPLLLPDVRILPGESIAVMGPSGAGKSSLLLVIGGLVRVATGTVSIAGAPLTDETAERHRSACSWVPQHPHFFSGPLRKTLTLGVPEAHEADITRALRLARADGVVAGLPAGIDTELGESGAGVSGGEARRLMIAKAALEDRPILLADEPTADLDPATAEQVRESLLALARRGKTLIVATHDADLASKMSRVIAVDGT